MSRITKDEIDRFFDYDVHAPTRTLYIGSTESSVEHGESGVDTQMAERVMKGLHILDAVKDSPIQIIMNNIGGDWFHGMAIYDAIQTCKNHVTITVYGHAMSMGAIIFCAADERIMAPNATLMIHYGTWNWEGHAKTGYKWSDHYKKIDVQMEQIFLEKMQEKHPTFSIKKLKRMLEFDTILTAPQAVSLGLADKILTRK